MTKEQTIELVQTYLGGGYAPSDVKKKYRKGILSEYIGIIFDEMLINVFIADTDPNKSSLNSYVKTYWTNTILTDAASGRFYCLIPYVSSAKLLQIPNNKAIKYVGTDEERFIYRELDSEDTWSELEVNTMLTIPRWYLEGERIYLSDHIDENTYKEGEPLAFVDLVIKAIVPYSEYDNDEDLPAPWGKDSLLFVSVIDLLRRQPPEEEIIDNNVTTNESGNT
jgi:hypothetical protein